MRCVALANPENRRATYFRDALLRQIGAPLEIIPWVDFLRGAPLPQDITLFRIESPGENHEVERLLIQRGADSLGIPCPEIDPAHGRIQHLSLWFKGFRSALDSLAHIAPHHFMNAPEGILAMTDKVESARRFNDHQVPTPARLGAIHSYEAFRELVQNQQSRLFIKPRYGSSASGVMAWKKDRTRQEITTSVELEGHKLFNSLKVRRYTSETQIAHIINTLGADELVVETWIPKATMLGRSFDLRVMAVRNKPPQHLVARLSKSPMTNLHLGNQRGEISEIVDLVGHNVWSQMLKTSTSALDCFPDALYSGFDVLFDVTKQKHFVIEANSFGDLLPNVFANGMDTYDLELMSWLESHDSNSKTLVSDGTSF